MSTLGLCDLVGKVLHDRYQIQQQLGKRAGRRSLLALDLETQNQVVVKLLTFSSEFEWDDLKLFEREANTLQSLTHPAIPRYLNYFELDLPNYKGFALVQTYIEALSLEDHLQSGHTFSEADIRQLAQMLLNILIYLHTRQPPVIHRDIKPSNILLTLDANHRIAQTYLVDFGAVQTRNGQESRTLTIVGTYGYMPPEQFGGRAVPASDLYSLGATLIYLATGQHPADLNDDDFRIQFEPTHLTPTLAWWLRRLTQPSLKNRFASASEALRSLEPPTLQTLGVQLLQRHSSSHPSRRGTDPRRATKPLGSKVTLLKKENALDIVLPPEGLTLRCAALTGLLAFAALNLKEVISLKLTFANLAAGGVFSIIAAICVWKVAFALAGRVRLRFGVWQMSATYELLGLKYRCAPLSRRFASRLQIAQSHTGWRWWYKGDRLILWVGVKKHELCNENTVTHPELNWLADEISHWLQVPISRD
ncbi:serine/threonine protein kinase [Oculatella sp. LEGE 06141]|uniref:serine/threonine protein kinase n=1 Tax=Oculatella sp. LEGE 06141 TaxID=1828648 RepID=UPI0018829AB8|nr:serine/threonine-protein kinase [Oculatella sp. LEGE 06141]MBE9178776.1 serine/threonine protein kinase [Oculatella sp. LEGE 06141]